MAKGWGHALAAVVGGYMTGDKIVRDGESREADKKQKAEDRAYLTTQRDRLTQQQGEEDSLRRDLRAAAQPIAMTEGAGGMVRPDTMDNRDVGLPENTAQPNDGLMPVAYRVGAQPYADRSAAQTAVDQQNKPEAMNQRVMAAYQGAGQFDKAAQIASTQQQQRAGQLALQQAEEGAQRDKTFRDVVTKFHAGGWKALPEIYSGYNDGLTAQVQEDGKGGATVIRTDADGKEAGRMAFASPLEFITGQVARMDPKLWIGMENQQAGREAQKAAGVRAQTNSDRDYALRAGSAAESARHNLATEAAKSKSADAKPLPTAALKMIQEGKDALGTASSINADLSAIDKQITDGKLTFGPVSNIFNAGRNAAGASNEESRNFATFRTNMEKLRNDSLRLNKGVQTDGDAQRAWNELFQSINDTKLVQQRLGEIQRLNERAVDLRKLDIDGVLGNYGHAPMDVTGYTKQKPALNGGAAAPGKQASAGAPVAGAQVKGDGGVSFVFRGGDPRDRKNWEPAQ